MLDLLEKFESVEITNDTRLAEADREFCEKQQALYIKVLKHYKNMFKMLVVAKRQNENFFDSINEENNYYRSDYKYKIYEHAFIKDDREEFAKIMEKTHDRFIWQIENYFKDKYNIAIKEKSFKNYYQLEKPESPRSYYGFSRISDEELEEYRLKEEQHKADLDKYYSDIINGEIHYNSIVDDIFLLLGGFSFEEQAANEIKQNSKNAVKGHGDKTLFELKNGKFDVTFDNHTNALNFAREFLGYTA